jgi:hypothetical protein
MIRKIYAFSFDVFLFPSSQLQITCAITNSKPRKEEAYYTNTMQPLKKRVPTNEDKAFSFTTVRKYKVIN